MSTKITTARAIAGLIILVVLIVAGAYDNAQIVTPKAKADACHADLEKLGGIGYNICIRKCSEEFPEPKSRAALACKLRLNAKFGI